MPLTLRVAHVVLALNQDRAAIDHNGLSSSESFLHQKQIGLRDVGSFSDSAHRETLAYAFVPLLAFFRTHVLPKVRADETGRYCIDPYWRDFDR